MAQHNLSAKPTHSRWNRALPPRLTIAPGDTVHFECVDSSGAQVHPGMNLQQYLAIDRSLIHALTGPVYIDGAAPGDVLEINVLEVVHKGWGWTSVVEGLGFLKHRFDKPYIFLWELESRRQPLARARDCAAASFLRRDGRRARRRWRIPHSPAWDFWREHGCSRTLHRRYAVSSRAKSRRALFRW